MGKNMHSEKLENINKVMVTGVHNQAAARLGAMITSLRVAGKPFVVVFSNRSTNNNGEVMDAEIVWGEEHVDTLLKYFVPNNSGAQGPSPYGVLVEPDGTGKMRPVQMNCHDSRCGHSISVHTEDGCTVAACRCEGVVRDDRAVPAERIASMSETTVIKDGFL
jgi:hypothetical protein